MTTSFPYWSSDDPHYRRKLSNPSQGTRLSSSTPEFYYCDENNRLIVEAYESKVDKQLSKLSGYFEDSWHENKNKDPATPRFPPIPLDEFSRQQNRKILQLICEEKFFK